MQHAETIAELVERMLSPLREALRGPDEHEQGLDALITQTESQTQLPASVRRELVASLEKQRKGLRATRTKAIGTCLQSRLKDEFGLIFGEVRVAQRRRAKPSPPPATKWAIPEQSEEDDPSELGVQGRVG